MQLYRWLVLYELLKLLRFRILEVERVLLKSIQIVIGTIIFIIMIIVYNNKHPNWVLHASWYFRPASENKFVLQICQVYSYKR